MFQGQRGWFCRSVSQDLRQFWVAEGGTISNVRAADFLFSCDASHPDTLRVYQSLDYTDDNATVFHAYYLSAVANAEVKNSVVLGHFLLPPACLQEEIRRKIGNFIWEQDQHFLTEKHDEVTPNEINALKESSELATDHKTELSKSTQKDFIRTPIVEKQMYFPLQNYPVNNMVTEAHIRLEDHSWIIQVSTDSVFGFHSAGQKRQLTEADIERMEPKKQLNSGHWDLDSAKRDYISIDAMKKFLGELHDFIPGSSGYLAYHVQNEINLSSIKNKLKRKC